MESPTTPTTPTERRLEDLQFFHPDLDSHKAQALLLNASAGTYLIRNMASKPGTYAVSVRSDNSVKNFPLEWTGAEYKFGHGEYRTIADLTYHFSNTPLLAGESGQTILLLHPYPRNISEPTIYEEIRVHAEQPTRDEETAQDFSINAKDGYLTKVGAIFKTWKLRWFEMKKNELKYFKKKDSKEPIRVLDLNECSECEMDDSKKDKHHVFRLKFPWRTFYLYANTEQESKEWVSVIQWRLNSRRKRSS